MLDSQAHFPQEVSGLNDCSSLWRRETVHLPHVCTYNTVTCTCILYLQCIPNFSAHLFVNTTYMYKNVITDKINSLNHSQKLPLRMTGIIFLCRHIHHSMAAQYTYTSTHTSLLCAILSACRALLSSLFFFNFSTSRTQLDLRPVLHDT